MLLSVAVIAVPTSPLYTCCCLPLHHCSDMIQCLRSCDLGRYSDITGTVSVSVMSLSDTVPDYLYRKYGEKRYFDPPPIENHQVWNMTTDLPVKRSTCITLNGQVLAIGGSSPCLTSDMNSVYIYNTAANSWEIISHMPTSRSLCLVALLPGNKLMVVGGRQSSYETDTVQITTALE